MSKYCLLWGCNPLYQFERPWLLHLINSDVVAEFSWWDTCHLPPSIPPNTVPVLVESGLLRLHRNLPPSHLVNLQQYRSSRINHLRSISDFVLIHLSDEEGYDADSFYNLLPLSTRICRNFHYPRFQEFNSFSFPIGPRDLFITKHPEILSSNKASDRVYPWSFLGTLWPTGSRKLAVSTFLRGLPQGFFYASQSFGAGLPLDVYRSQLLQSTFVLCPEGDRHLDTFRFWEALSCGCIPLLVDFNKQAKHLLPHPHPIPVFNTWYSAYHFARNLLSRPSLLNSLQLSIHEWWNSYLIDLRANIFP